MMKAEQARFGVKVIEYTKADRDKWTKQEQSMWKTQLALGGKKKATKYMTSYFKKKSGTSELGGSATARKPSALESLAAPSKTTSRRNPINSAHPEAGQLVCCGSLDWATVGSKDVPRAEQNNLWGFHRLVFPGSVRVSLVCGGASARHIVAVDTEGFAWTWGRNTHGQLGLGDTDDRALPAKVEQHLSHPVRSAGCGQHHTVLIAGADRAVQLYSCGLNKSAQLGIGHADSQSALPVEVSTKWADGARVCKVECGAEFSVCCADNGAIATWGHPQYGQLGNGTNGEMIVTQGKVEYDYQVTPSLVKFSEPAIIVDVRCGTHHSIALTDDGRVFTWGFGGYGRLGINSPADMMTPVPVAFNTQQRGTFITTVAAGATCCYATDANGSLFFWGKTKNTGEATMYPKVVDGLRGWECRAVASGNTHTVCASERSLISWGPSPVYGELGYGEDSELKSSTTPQKADDIEGATVNVVVCCYAHTCALVADDPASKVVLEKLPVLQDYEVRAKRETYRGPSGYMLFGEAERARYKAEHKAGGKKVPFAVMAKEIGAAWQALAFEESEKWELEADRRRIAAGFADEDDDIDSPETKSPRGKKRPSSSKTPLSRAAKRRMRADAAAAKDIADFEMPDTDEESKEDEDDAEESLDGDA